MLRVSLNNNNPLIILVIGSNKENIAADVAPIIDTPNWNSIIATTDVYNEIIIIRT